MLRAQDNPDACGCEHFMSPKLERQTQLPLDPVSHSRRFACMFDVLYENRELITTDACHRITRAQTMQQPACEFNQQLISNGVPQTVIDKFEAIEIQEKKCKRIIFSALYFMDGLSETIVKQDPVRQLRQDIVKRLPFQCRLYPFALGNVFACRQDSDRFAGIISDDFGNKLHRKCAAVFSYIDRFSPPFAHCLHTFASEGIPGHPGGKNSCLLSNKLRWLVAMQQGLRAIGEEYIAVDVGDCHPEVDGFNRFFQYLALNRQSHPATQCY